jgi:hypothetical protein
MNLFKDDLALWSMQRTPLGDMSAQRDNLGRPIAAWMLLDEQSEQGGGLQRWITFELSRNPLPVLRVWDSYASARSGAA